MTDMPTVYAAIEWLKHHPSRPDPSAQQIHAAYKRMQEQQAAIQDALTTSFLTGGFPIHITKPTKTKLYTYTKPGPEPRNRKERRARGGR